MAKNQIDAIVVGAGFSGMYLLHKLRRAGFCVRVFEEASDVGGTWFWNRYPGARVDIPSLEYSYSFDPQLEMDWQWSEKYAPQPELLRYAQHVADRYDLRRDITFGTRVNSAKWDENAKSWNIKTSSGEEISARYYIMATGCLSMPKDLDIAGVENFKGHVYHTSRWPHEKVDFTGMRVAVIGTGSSGIQSIPLIAKEAKQLVVFQRTPCFSIPAGNGPIPAELLEKFRDDRESFRATERTSQIGTQTLQSTVSSSSVSNEDRNTRYEAEWEKGVLFEFLGSYMDHLTNADANLLLAEFVRNKIRAEVKDPVTAEALCPKTYPIGLKRLCLDTNYYETFNLPHVRLIDLQKHPIASVTTKGIDLSDESLEFDAIVFATGFDAMTGALVNVDIEGRDGLTLREVWSHGPVNYLGLQVAGFPNLFMITGPGSPSVLSNMMVSIEQHADWVVECLERLRSEGFESIEATETAQAGWVQHANDFADLTLISKAKSWYMGDNIPGKPRVAMPYVGGVGTYRAICDKVAANDFLGFKRQGPSETRCNDGVIRAVAPDIQMMLDAMATMGLPAPESLPPEMLRAFSEQLASMSPPGPQVGEIVDGTLPGAVGDLNYRIYRPQGKGPYPALLYFHGGGFVIGNQISDDPFCRDLCNRSGVMVISVDYRHAPEAPFPAAVEDGFAALKWVSAHISELLGIPGQLAVGGFSAGGTLAAVVAQLAREAGGPKIAGQLLVAPATDRSTTRESFVSNAEGFFLTAALVDYFWKHYTCGDKSLLLDPRVSPLKAPSLQGLPPAFVITPEFDPLLDEGKAYADALSTAGVATQYVFARGQIHTSLHAVGVLRSSEHFRGQIAEALKNFFS